MVNSDENAKSVDWSLRTAVLDHLEDKFNCREFDVKRLSHGIYLTEKVEPVKDEHEKEIMPHSGRRTLLYVPIDNHDIKKFHGEINHICREHPVDVFSYILPKDIFLIKPSEKRLNADWDILEPNARKYVANLIRSDMLSNKVEAEIISSKPENASMICFEFNGMKPVFREYKLNPVQVLDRREKENSVAMQSTSYRLIEEVKKEPLELFTMDFLSKNYANLKFQRDTK